MSFAAGKPPHAIRPDDPPAIALIKEDHQMFRALFDVAAKANGRPLISLTGEICIRLAVHMSLEEEILYPALRPAIGSGKIAEAIVEHDLAKALIVDLVRMTGGEELYKTRVHLLGEEIMQHIDEEDRGLLLDARMAWEQGKIDLSIVFSRMQERREQLYAAIAGIGGGYEADIAPVGDAIEEYAGPTPHAWPLHQ